MAVVAGGVDFGRMRTAGFEVADRMATAGVNAAGHNKR
jgi:hypothetical protein